MTSQGSRTVRVLLGGGIGAGKSRVLEMFERAGFSVVEADEIGREVLGPARDETRSVADLWPEAVSDGVVDRQALARIVFSDPDALRRLEAITHPAIGAEIDRRARSAPGDVVVEIPVLHLAPPGEWRRVAVVADVEVRVERAVARGGDASDIRRRVASQASREEWVTWADIVVENDGSWAVTEAAVTAVIKAVRP